MGVVVVVGVVVLAGRDVVVGDCVALMVAGSWNSLHDTIVNKINKIIKILVVISIDFPLGSY